MLESLLKMDCRGLALLLTQNLIDKLTIYGFTRQHVTVKWLHLFPTWSQDVRKSRTETEKAELHRKYIYLKFKSNNIIILNTTITRIIIIIHITCLSLIFLAYQLIIKPSNSPNKLNDSAMHLLNCICNVIYALTTSLATESLKPTNLTYV